MARPRKPTELHVISGSARKHPDRMRERDGEPDVSGDLRDIPPPSCLDAEHKRTWKELQKMLHVRVAGESDVLAFESLVRLTVIVRSGEARAADFVRQQAYLGEFGMTPASRSKVAAAKKADEPKGFAALKGVG